ncbi:alpha/beta fold hydrolase [Sphingobium ummariense]
MQGRRAADRRRFRLVTPDLRGAGGSARPLTGYDKSTLAADLAGVLDSLGIETPAVVVGHDIGAMVAFTFAHRFPKRTPRLAILDSVILGTEMFDELARAGTKGPAFPFPPGTRSPRGSAAGSGGALSRALRPRHGLQPVGDQGHRGQPGPAAGAGAVEDAALGTRRRRRSDAQRTYAGGDGAEHLRHSHPRCWPLAGRREPRSRRRCAGGLASQENAR